MDPEQQQAFRAAVDRKSREAEAASHSAPQPDAPEGGVQGTQENLVSPAENQDTFSVRDKNSGKGHKTADKWNQ